MRKRSNSQQNRKKAQIGGEMSPLGSATHKQRKFSSQTYDEGKKLEEQKRIEAALNRAGIEAFAFFIEPKRETKQR